MSTSSAPLPPIARRLWKTVGVMAVLIATFVGMNLFLTGDKKLRGGDLGHDFFAFYTAGTFVRQGDFAKIYDMTAVRDFEFGVAKQIGLALGPGFMPWWNPPFFALAVAPLTNLEYRTALHVWLGINLACVAGACWMLIRIFRDTGLPPVHLKNTEDHRPEARVAKDWRVWALIPASIAVSIPFILSLTHGQNTGISLLLLTGTVLLWRNRQAFAAGVVCGLMFYKPQLGALVAVALTIRLGWRAMAGVACTGVALLVITIFAMPGSLHAFLFQMPVNLTWFQEANQYYWERHVTFKSFWRLLLQHHDRGPTAIMTIVPWSICTVMLAMPLLATLWRKSHNLASADRDTEDRAIAATVACSPLLMPFYFDYDLLLMAVPIVLYAAERMRSNTPTTKLDRWTTIGWCISTFYVLLNPHVADLTNVDALVLLIAGCATTTVVRALQHQPQQTIETIDEPTPLRLAA